MAQSSSTVVGSGSASAGTASASRPGFSLRTFDSLQDRNFRWFFLALLGHMGAMNMQMLVRGWLTYDLTGSYAKLGVVALAQAMPMLGLSVFGGVLADRFPKRRIVQTGQFVSAINATVVAVMLFSDVLVFWHLIVASVAQGIVMALMMPSRQAMIPEVVGMDRMMNAVALNSAGMNMMRLLAPGIGGVLIGVFGAGIVYSIMASLYMSCVLFLFKVPSTPAAAPLNGAPRKGGFADLVAGLKYIRTDRVMAVLLAMNFITSMLAMPYLMLLPGYVEDVYNLGPEFLGLMITVSGGGALVGALVIASLPPARRGLLLMASAILIGLALTAFASTDMYVLGLVMMVFVGLGTAGRQALGQVLIHNYVENEYRGRVMSVYMTQFSVMSLGVFVIGLISEQFGVQAVFAALGLLLVAVTTLLLFTMPRLRRLD
ncbi:MAG: MFS transporter [Dehalococcoidia bacterium]|nr:MFS transporter [Dehalococcoidia bacterium]MCA9853438.1 MFS transporter [Dehalococcoidia bacterium]